MPDSGSHLRSIVIMACFVHARTPIQSSISYVCAWVYVHVSVVGRAAASGKCPHAKTEIAQLILQQIKSENPTAILDALTSNPQGNTDDNRHRNSRSSTKHSTRNSTNAHNSASFGASVPGVAMSTSSMTSANRALLRQSLRSLYTSDGVEADEDEDEEDGVDEDVHQRESRSRQRRLWKEEEQDVQQAMALLLEAANEGHVEAKTQLVHAWNLICLHTLQCLKCTIHMAHTSIPFSILRCLCSRIPRLLTTLSFAVLLTGRSVRGGGRCRASSQMVFVGLERWKCSSHLPPRSIVPARYVRTLCIDYALPDSIVRAIVTSIS